MKNLFLIILLGFTLFSCQKEELLSTQTNEEVLIDQTISLFGEWLLVDGKMYMENMETGELVVYNHFDGTKTVSSVRYSGSMFPIETIELDVTTWTFKDLSYDEFWLNHDSISPYGLHVNNTSITITEHSAYTTQQMGGSAKPINAFIDDYDEQRVNFYVHESYESINGVNYKYFSELTFEKQ